MLHPPSSSAFHLKPLITADYEKKLEIKNISDKVHRLSG